MVFAALNDSYMYMCMLSQVYIYDILLNIIYREQYCATLFFIAPFTYTVVSRKYAHPFCMVYTIYFNDREGGGRLFEHY